MRLDFNVLWVDDQPKRVEAHIERIAIEMRERGFDFKVKACRSLDEVKSLIKEDVFNDEYDLILVDFDLGTGVEGQEAISEIRERMRFMQYKDVVFYSAQTTPENLRKLVFEANLEGIYCASREELVDEVVGVFESLVKKVLDLDHSRGIVMGATSDIDNMVNQCLIAMHDKLDDAGKRRMLVDATKRTADRIKDLTKTATKLKDATTLQELFEEHAIFTANDRLRILSHTLEMPLFEAHHESRAYVVDYMNRVVPRRNTLGHQVLVPEGKLQATDNKGEAITLEETRELRRLILDLRTEFRKLLAALQNTS